MKKDNTRTFLDTIRNIVYDKQYVLDSLHYTSDLDTKGYYETLKDISRDVYLNPVESDFPHKTDYSGKMMDISTYPTDASKREPTQENFEVYVGAIEKGKGLVMFKDDPSYKRHLRDAQIRARLNQYAGHYCDMISKVENQYRNLDLGKINFYALHIAEGIATLGITRVNLNKDSVFTPHLKRELEKRGIYVLIGGERYPTSHKDHKTYLIAEYIRYSREGNTLEARQKIDELIEQCRETDSYAPEVISNAYKKADELLSECYIEMPISFQLEEADRRIDIAAKNADVIALNKAMDFQKVVKSKEAQLKKERGEVNKTTNRSDGARD